MSTTLLFIYGCSFIAFIATLAYTKKVLSVSITGKDKEIKSFHRISGAIEEGSRAFLKAEYKYVAIFCLFFSLVVFFALKQSTQSLSVGIYTAASFLIGAIVSTVAAFIGMNIAVKGNVRTAIKARTSLSTAFEVAFSAGAVMGFGLCGLAVFGLISICWFFYYIVPNTHIAM